MSRATGRLEKVPVEESKPPMQPPAGVKDIMRKWLSLSRKMTAKAKVAEDNSPAKDKKPAGQPVVKNLTEDTKWNDYLLKGPYIYHEDKDCWERSYK